MKLHIQPEATKAAQAFQLPEKLEFGKCLAPVMVKATYKNNEWSDLEIVPYGPLELDPCAKVLHYGQEIFEGMKAYKNEKGEVNLFRPTENFKRFNHSARRMAMPEVSQDFFYDFSGSISQNLQRFYSDQRRAFSLYAPYDVCHRSKSGN